MTIVLDDRHGAVELKPLIRFREVEVRHMEFSDISWEGNGPLGPGTVRVGIERKKINDWVGSVKSGRFLAHQLPGMLAQFDRVYLILEGDMSYSREGEVLQLRYNSGSPVRGFTRVEIEGIERSVRNLFGVQVIHTRDETDTVRWLELEYSWWREKLWDQHRTALGAVKSTLPMTDANGFEYLSLRAPSLMTRVAAQLPGIGLTRAGNCQRTFKSVREMMTAGVREWMKVEGVGKGTARKVVAALVEGEEDEEI